jgi:hypothetical protein
VVAAGVGVGAGLVAGDVGVVEGRGVPDGLEGEGEGVGLLGRLAGGVEAAGGAGAGREVACRPGCATRRAAGAAGFGRTST